MGTADQVRAEPVTFIPPDIKATPGERRAVRDAEQAVAEAEAHIASVLHCGPKVGYLFGTGQTPRTHLFNKYLFAFCREARRILDRRNAPAEAVLTDAEATEARDGARFAVLEEALKQCQFVHTHASRQQTVTTHNSRPLPSPETPRNRAARNRQEFLVKLMVVSGCALVAWWGWKLLELSPTAEPPVRWMLVPLGAAMVVHAVWSLWKEAGRG